MNALKEHKNNVDAFGYSCIKQVYNKSDIDKIAEKFDQDFSQRLAKGQVQSRDFRRYACKLPICDDYLAILNNPTVHQLLTEILGEDYVLFNFNSHSSLPGSSAQLMHVDTVDPRNSDTYVNSQTNVVFLHIPMLDTQKQHGVTGIWPATLFRQTNSISDSDIYQWVKNHLPQSTAQLERGDVILKRDNCIHAGGANRSEVRRHMITLIFARKNYYLTYNSGMIPCLDYSQALSEPLPYRIASDCRTAPQCPEKFISEKVDKISFSAKELKQKINFLQHEVLEQAIKSELIQRLRSDKIDTNLLLNIINSNKALVSAALQSHDFRLHSAKIEKTGFDFSCDDEGFKTALNGDVLNNKSNSLKLHIALEDSEFSVYAGNKVLSQTVLQDSSAHTQQIKHYSLKSGDILLTTGSLVYAKNTASRCLVLSFTQPYYIPSYDDRLYLTDSYFLSLPNSLSSLIRYDQVLITQEKYQHFQYNRRTHFAYIVINSIGNIKVKNKLLGNLATVASFIVLAPVGLYFLARRTKSKAKQALESY